MGEKLNIEYLTISIKPDMGSKEFIDELQSLCEKYAVASNKYYFNEL